MVKASSSAAAAAGAEGGTPVPRPPVLAEEYKAPAAEVKESPMPSQEEEELQAALATVNRLEDEKKNLTEETTADRLKIALNKIKQLETENEALVNERRCLKRALEDGPVDDKEDLTAKEPDPRSKAAKTTNDWEWDWKRNTWSADSWPALEEDAHEGYSEDESQRSSPPTPRKLKPLHLEEPKAWQKWHQAGKEYKPSTKPGPDFDQSIMFPPTHAPSRRPNCGGGREAQSP